MSNGFIKKEEFISYLSKGQKYRDGILRYKCVPKTIKKDFDCVMAAVKNNGLNLKDADISLKGNFGIVKAAVEEDSDALQYAPDFQSNEEILLLIARKNEMLFYIDPNKLKDKAFLEKLIEIEPQHNVYHLIPAAYHKLIPKGLKGQKHTDFTYEEVELFIEAIKSVPIK